MSNGWKPILDIYVSRAFQWYKELFNPLSFDPCNCLTKMWESIETQIPKVKAPFGSVKVHSFTLSYTPGSMWCDSRTFLLAHNLANPCFGLEPNAKVTTYFTFNWIKTFWTPFVWLSWPFPSMFLWYTNTTTWLDGLQSPTMSLIKDDTTRSSPDTNKLYTQNLHLDYKYLFGTPIT